MLTVEQVRSLDEKVRRALGLIETLKSENIMLRKRLDEYKQKIDQLESVVDGFKLEQLEIEEGIKEVLGQLDQLEDQITAPPVSDETKYQAVPEVTISPAELSVAGIEIGSEEPETVAQNKPVDQEPPELEIF